MNTKYTTYTAEDFANDPAFWVWVLEEDTEVIAFWETFVEQHPEKRGEVEAARRIVLELNGQEQEPKAEQVEHLWRRIQQSKTVRQENERVLRGGSVSIARWMQAATIVLGFISLAVALYFVMLDGGHTEVASKGENKKEVWLPDGSLVVLNKSSEIRYNPAWDSLQTREVWLDGEAFFEVVHKQNNQKFVVHSGGLYIEVLGTSFNVDSRTSKTRVVLSSGKIRLHLNQVDNPKNKVIEMKPGEMVEYNPQQAQAAVKQVNPQKFIAWKNGQMIFEEETLGEIFQQVQVSHGLRVVVPDSSILDLKFTGTVPADQLSILLEGIAEAHQLKIERSEKIIHVSLRR